MERRLPEKKHLVGNDIVFSPHHKPKSTRPIKHFKIISEITVPAKKSSPTLKPTVVSESVEKRNVSKTQSSEPNLLTSGVIEDAPLEHSFNQALVNAIAYDTLIIVVLAYIGFISKWLIFFIIGYALVVLIFRFNSRRMFISAALSIITLVILKLINKNVLGTAFLELSLFYILIGTIRLGIEQFMSKQL